jgi:anti-sigma B factor antagonist
MTPTIVIVHEARRVLVSISGELDLATRDLLRERCATVPPAPELVIDLTGLAFVDCGSLRVLERLMVDCTAAGGRARVVAPDGPVRRVLEISGFADLHEVQMPADVRSRGPARPSAPRAAQ